MEKIYYEVLGRKADRDVDTYFGSYETVDEATERIERLKRTWPSGEYTKYHDDFVVVPVLVDVTFEIPPKPVPRERYRYTTTPIDKGKGYWNYLDVEVFDGDISVAKYQRQYGSMIRTFEPFRQGNRNFALISADYTATSVLDLDTGEIIASEPSDAHGFCPAGFYVPDWWDLHDGSILPGSRHWDTDDEWPTGDFGFVWGCVWGDDTSWKVEYLDLSKVSEGIIARDDRFGYCELATIGDDPSKFIDVRKEGDVVDITFAVEMHYRMGQGWNKYSIESLNEKRNDD